MKKIKCPKCNKFWYRYLDKIITKDDLPYFCPYCEEDKLKDCNPISLTVEILKQNKLKKDYANR